MPEGQVWKINYRLYICAIETDQSQADMTIYDINLYDNGNRTHNFALDHIEKEHYRRSLINTNDMHDIMSISWSRQSTSLRIAGTFDIKIDQLKNDKVEIRIPTDTVANICESYSIKPTDLVQRILEVPAIDSECKQMMYATSKVTPTMRGSCNLNCGFIHGEWCKEKFGEAIYLDLDKCPMAQEHTFVDPITGEEKQWNNPSRSRCHVCYAMPPLPKGYFLDTQERQWNPVMYDQWVRKHDCVAEKLNSQSQSYDKQVSHIRAAQDQYKAVQVQSQLRKRSAEQIAAAKAQKESDDNIRNRPTKPDTFKKKQRSKGRLSTYYHSHDCHKPPLQDIPRHTKGQNSKKPNQRSASFENATPPPIAQYIVSLTTKCTTTTISVSRLQQVYSTETIPATMNQLHTYVSRLYYSPS
jgi:hypothetical protein